MSHALKAKRLDHKKCRALAESLGMSVSDDGVAFTVCGAQLVNGEPAPYWIARMNGLTVEEVAKHLGGSRGNRDRGTP
jgi:hypothetical protein